MGFYDLSKAERSKLFKQIHDEIGEFVLNVKYDGVGNISAPEILVQYVSNEDGYIRKAVYMAVAKIYWENKDFHQKFW